MKAVEFETGTFSDMQNLIRCLLTDSVPDDKYFVLNRDIFNATYLYAIIYKKKIAFSHFFLCNFPTPRLSFEHFPKKGDTHS